MITKSETLLNSNSKIYHITTPLSLEDTRSLRSGDTVYLSGIIYTARDSAHKRMVEQLSNKIDLPFNPVGAVIYYCGPSPASPERVIGSAGPTTSYRMDKNAPILYELGVRATIGKGKRSDDVKASIIKNNAIYFAATGGAGALISKCIKSSKVLAFSDLGPEAVHELYIENMPLKVINDTFGGELYCD